MVQETHLSQGNSAPKIANYDLYRNDRQRSSNSNANRGGTAIYIKRSIAHQHIATPPLQILEATIIKIPIQNSPPITLISGYLPPHTTGSNFPTGDFQKLFSLSANVILVGDFNSHHTFWGNRRNNSYGIKLNSWTQSSRIQVIAPDSPTHFSHTGTMPSVIDLALFKNIPFAYRMEVLNDLNSDHLPVAIHLNSSKINLNSPGQIKTDWKIFQQELANRPLPLLKFNTKTDAESVIKYINDSFNEAKIKASKPISNSRPIYLPVEIKTKIRLRNRLRRKFQKTRDPAYFSEMRSLQYEIRSEIQALKEKNWSEFCDTLSENHTALWKAFRSKRKPFNPIPPLNSPNGVVFLPQEKSEVIACSLENQFKPHDIPDNYISKDFSGAVLSYLQRPYRNNLKPATAYEISNFIQKLKPDKAPGIDNISNRMIKNAPLKFILLITYLINFLLQHSYFPDIWKTAVIIPIHKANQDPAEAVNYRPISLLPSLSKIYEFILLNRLREFCNDKNIIIPEQFGFRKGHSTVHQLLRVIEFIHEGFRRGETTGAIFLDVAKAFDRVLHSALLLKIMRLNFSCQFVHIMCSFLNNRNFCVKVGQSLSNPHLIHAGVPQGSLISPILFCLYINDIPRSPALEIACYADDTAILTRSRVRTRIMKTLQNYLNDLMLWLVTWKIKINASKSVAILFHKKKHPDPPTNLTIFQEPIPWDSKIKYLGITLDSNLRFNHHVDNVLKTANIAKAQLRPFIGPKSRLSIKAKTLAYTSILRPIFTYGIQVWHQTTATKQKAIQTFQNKTLRSITRAPWFVRNEVIHNNLNMPTIHKFTKRLSNRFYSKIYQIPNPAIHKIPVYNPANPSSAKRPRSILNSIDKTFPERPKKQRKLNPIT